MILEGDCKKLMAEMERGSVSLIMTSPPYAMARKKTYGGIRPDEYVDWFMPIAEQMRHVLAEDGSLVVNIKEGCKDGERLTYVLELILEMRSCGWLWTEEYIWHKTNAAPGKWPNRFRDGWERLLHFTKSNGFKMNQEAVMMPTGESTRKRMKNLSERDRKRNQRQTGSRFAMKYSNWEEREMSYPDNVLHGPGECSNKGHPAVYPEWLPEFFVRLFTDEGDLVLDPFCGSGTTGVAALRLGRGFCGMDVMPEYVSLAKRRILAIQPPLPMMELFSDNGSPREQETQNDSQEAE